MPDGRKLQARGVVHGELLREPVGENGFGYDPIFFYPPKNCGMAQMSPEEKNKISHRAVALDLLYKKLEEFDYADK